MTSTSLKPKLSSLDDSPEGAELRIAVERVATLKVSVKPAEEDVRLAGRRYLMAASDNEEELMRRAAVVYWECPGVPVSVVAEILFGNPKKIQNLGKMLPCPTAWECQECGGPVAWRSRYEIVNNTPSADHQTMIDDGVERWIVYHCLPCSAKVEQKRKDLSADGRRKKELADLQRKLALRTMSYQDYLMTDEWAAIRLEKLKQSKFRCQLCNSEGLLNVHHRTYERRGCEDTADLITLCRSCHAKFHGKLP